jgi:hypothetical protein
MKKLTLLLLKAVPVIGAICCASNSLLSYFGYDLAWMGYVLYIAFLLGWLALASYFRFCSFYFMLILYILLSEGLNLIEYFHPLPLSERDVFILHCGIIGFMILFFTYFHVRDTRKLKEHLKGGK